MHADFGEIRLDESFHDCVKEQTIDTQNALYKNNSDARSASRAIDLYKYDMSKSNTKTKSKSAAHAVGRTSTSAPTSGGRATFSESQVQQMSMQEFSKHEEAIQEAMQNGTFSYDLSGGAR